MHIYIVDFRFVRVCNILYTIDSKQKVKSLALRMPSSLKSHKDKRFGSGPEWQIIVGYRMNRRGMRKFQISIYLL